jgi:uncharacterized protein with ParB-like and HNH nuclease domain
MSKLTNKIEANDRTILEVLDNKKYTVDYFQREYSWKQQHIEQLITDLTSAFLSEYDPGHERSNVENYNSYYLGPFVLSEKDGKRSIIDGQQRLTSLSLFLIYLNNLQKTFGTKESIESMIFSERFGVKSFNIQVEERIPCLQSLFDLGEYKPKDTEDDSTKNMVARYEDIVSAFPKEIDEAALPYFLDWMKECVALVEIVAYSDDNAYTIFETMNDRGLNLTPTEMLKGFVLSRFKDFPSRHKANELWKKSIQKLHAYDKSEDQRFFQAWLRAQYADTIRPGKAGSKNEDFEKIGTRFHSWVRDNLGKMSLDSDSSSNFVNFVNQDFQFYLKAYLKILDAERQLTPGLEHIYYIQRWGIASSLGYPLMIAPLQPTDTDEVVKEKLNLVARYIETFVVRRSINFRKFSSSSIRYTMYVLVKEIRNKSISELKSILASKLGDMDEGWHAINNFRLHGQNRRFVKFLLSRMTSFVEQETGMTTTFETYYHSPGGKPFEVEHIWANKFNRHSDEFEQKDDFNEFRNRLGGLLLLPQGTNQSFGDKPYPDKFPFYIRENLLAQSLCPLTYQNYPNFLTMKDKLGLPFKSHHEFKKQDILDRQGLYQEICEMIWAIDTPDDVQSDNSVLKAETTV